MTYETVRQRIMKFGKASPQIGQRPLAATNGTRTWSSVAAKQHWL